MFPRLFPRRPSHPLLDVLRAIRDDIRHGLQHLHEIEEIIVANSDAVAHLTQRVDALTAAVDAAKQRIADDFQALRDQLDNGATDTAAVDAAVAKLDASIAALDSVDPDPANPVEAPVDEPTG